MLRRQDELVKLHSLEWKFFTVHSVNEFGQCSCKKDACGSPGKHPVEYKWQQTARRWPHPFPERYNVGVPCGTQCIVLDVDPRNGGKETLDALIRKHGELPKTWTVLTGGNGFHFYFKAPHDEFPSGNALKSRGVELKGHGSFVIGPGSVHTSGSQYEWQENHRPEDLPLSEAPEWLLKECFSSNPKSVSQWDGTTDLEELIDALSSLNPDMSRGEWIRVGAALKTAGVSFEQWNKWSSTGSKYNEKEMLAQWESLEAGRVNPETIFYLAYEQGWTPKLDETPLNFLPPRKDNLEEHTEIKCPELPDNTIFKEIANEILRTAMHEHRQFAIAATLSVLSAVAQGSYYTPIKEGYVGSYYILMAGAAAGKEHYASRVIDVVRMVAENRILRMPSSSQALRFDLASCNARVLFMDEALRVLQNKIESKSQFDQQLISDILSMWGMSSKILSGYSTKREQDKTPDVKMPFLSIIGCGTTEKFDYLLRRSADFISDGVLSRFDIIHAEYSNSSKLDLFDDAGFCLSENCIKTLKEIDGNPNLDSSFVLPKTNDTSGTKREETFYYTPKRASFSDNEAMRLWQKIFVEFQNKALNDSENNIASSLWNRAAEKILRTATLLAIVRNPGEPKVSTSDIQWSRRWHEWVVSKMEERVLDKAGQSVESEIGEIILEQLRRHVAVGEFVPVGFLRQTSRKLRSQSPKIIEEAIRGLEMSGIIKIRSESKNRMGRPSLFIALG